MKNYYFQILCLFAIKLSVHSQDMHFSQFNENPSLLNPALVGSTSVLRASAVYKDQWRGVTTPYKTYGISVDSKFKASNWELADQRRTMTFKQSFSKLAGGLSFYNDKAGDGNFNLTQLNLSLSSMVPVSDKSNLSLGLQASVIQRKLDYSKLIFPDQYNGTIYDPNIQSSESMASGSFRYPDFAAGLNWSYGSKEKSIGSNDQLKANIGTSFFHIAKPRQKYLAGSNERLALKFVLHGDFLIGIKHTNLALAPSYLLQFQGPNKELMIGTLLKYYLNDDSKYTGIIQRTSIGLGVYYRNKDAVILYALMEWKQQYSIGFSYDINVSGLATVSKLNGGPEIVLRFNTPSAFLYQKKSKASF